MKRKKPEPEKLSDDQRTELSRNRSLSTKGMPTSRDADYVDETFNQRGEYNE